MSDPLLGVNCEIGSSVASCNGQYFRQTSNLSNVKAYLGHVRTRSRLGGLYLNSPYRSPAGTQEGICWPEEVLERGLGSHDEMHKEELDSGAQMEATAGSNPQITRSSPYL